MKKYFFAVCCFLVLWIVAAVTETYAHGGGHSKPKAAEITVEDTSPATPPAGDVGNFYSVEGEEADSPPSPFSRTDLFSGGMEMQPSAPGHEEMKHAQHQVKLAQHELVSPSQKGYKVAVGITALAGVFFAVLGIKRKREN